MSPRRRRRTGVVIPVAVVALAIAAVFAAFSLGAQGSEGGSRLDGSSSGRAFAWFTPAPAPPSWRRLRLPGGSGVLSVPPLLHPVAGDDGTVSAALFTRGGAYLAYLNATPLQGDETLNGWARFRLDHLREDDARSARQQASATMLGFRGGTGSCVTDDYVTMVGAHRFREIACLVKGGNGGSVVVAAAPPAEWPRLGPLLERAVASYSVG